MSINWGTKTAIGVRAFVTSCSFRAYAALTAYAKGYSNVAIALNGLFELDKEMERGEDRKNTSYP